jgi:hypothetical protein
MPETQVVIVNGKEVTPSVKKDLCREIGWSINTAIEQAERGNG